MKKIFLICNAHLDPVWQWEWEEGAAEAISTFRVAARFCEEYDAFIFNHNEVTLYKWIEEYEPELFEKIRELVKKGKWHIMGGWFLQPDCNMPSGEAFVRQIMAGRKYFYEKFGACPTTAINFDPFGHSRGLVQIMKKSGFDSYLFGRPSKYFLNLPQDDFEWVGFDGSSVMAKRFTDSWYNSGLGQAVEKIKKYAEGCPDGDFDACLWGVGNHGGGPSKKDLDDITEYQKEAAEQGIEVMHATPEMYFSEVKARRTLPKFCNDLNPWGVGCYTSQVRIKQKYRSMENTYFMTEKMCAFAVENGLMEYPAKELEEALQDMLTVQFHDALPGSSIQPVEEMSLRVLDHGLEILSRIKARAFFALASGQKQAKQGEYPILIFNPHPYPIEDDFVCEFMLADANWNKEYSNPAVYHNGVKIDSQCEKENSTIPLDWRKRVVFHARLEPMSMNRFDCVMAEVLPEKPVPAAQGDESYYIMNTDRLEVKINKKTGLIDKLAVDGVDYLDKNAFMLNVINDDHDPWGMEVTGFKEKIGEFKLMSAEEGSRLSELRGVIPSVRVIEDGAVRTVFEAVFGYNRSYAIVNYKIPKNSARIEISVRVIWVEAEKMIKMSVPAVFKLDECLGDTAYGEQKLRFEGEENVSQKYIVASGGDKAFALVNGGTYGSSCTDNTLYMTLLRSAGYTAHPISDRIVMPQDRFSPHIEQGERIFEFVFDAGNTAEIKRETPRYANIYAEKPMCMSFYPSGGGKEISGGISLDGDSEIILTAYKKQENGSGYVLRLYNASPDAKRTLINGEYKAELGAYEIKTLLYKDGKFSEYALMEDIIK